MLLAKDGRPKSEGLFCFCFFFWGGGMGCDWCASVFLFFSFLSWGKGRGILDVNVLPSDRRLFVG